MTVTEYPRTVGFAMSKSDEQREWINKVLAHFRLNVTRLATQSGINPSTLSKFMASRRDGHTLTTTTIDRIEKKFGIRYPNEPGNGRPGGLEESEAAPFDVNAAPGNLTAVAVKALVAGVNSRVPWILKSSVLSEIGVLPGDVLIVDMNEQAKEGDVVCAQVYDKAGNAETVFRIFKHPYFLVGAGPGARLPFMVDDRTAQVRGTVVSMFRPRGISAAVA